jgi:hypothetical protein
VKNHGLAAAMYVRFAPPIAWSAFTCCLSVSVAPTSGASAALACCSTLATAEPTARPFDCSTPCALCAVSVIGHPELKLKSPSMTSAYVPKVAGSTKNEGTKWTAFCPVRSGWFLNCVDQPWATELWPNVHDSPAAEGPVSGHISRRVE